MFMRWNRRTNKYRGTVIYSNKAPIWIDGAIYRTQFYIAYLAAQQVRGGEGKGAQTRTSYEADIRGNAGERGMRKEKSKEESTETGRKGEP